MCVCVCACACVCVCVATDLLEACLEQPPLGAVGGLCARCCKIVATPSGKAPIGARPGPVFRLFGEFREMSLASHKIVGTLVLLFLGDAFWKLVATGVCCWSPP